MGADDGLITNAMNGLVPGLGIGLFVGSARAYLSGLSHAQAVAAGRVVANPPLRLITTTTAMFATVGAMYTATEPIVRSARDNVDDPWNGAVAGCAAGALVGVRNGSLATSCGACASFAAISAFIEVVPSGNDDTMKRRKAVYGMVDQ